MSRSTVTNSWMRAVYIAELAVLALPFIAVMGFLALIGGLYACGATLVGLFMLVELSAAGTGVSDAVGIFALGALGLSACVTGLLAMFIFVRLSGAYLFRQGQKLEDRWPQFVRGGALAILPLCVTGTLGAVLLAYAEDGPSLALAIFASGAGLLIPVLHLGIALRCAGRSTA